MRAFAIGPRFKGGSATLTPDQFQEQFLAAEAEETEFWKLAEIDAELLVELPFWMLVEDGSVDVEYGPTRLNVRVVQDFLAVYDGPFTLSSQANVCWIGQRKDFPKEGLGDSVRCPVFRELKTVLIVPVRIRNGVIATLNSGLQIEAHEHSLVRQYNRADQYVNTLAFAHLPALNNLIAKYRSSSHDPFASEITEFDVPSWFLRTSDSFCHFIVMPYWASDNVPGYSSEGGFKAFIAADVRALSSSSTAKLTPGQHELLDATSYMFRGRYNEAIRYSVTAIEVLIEEQLRSLYTRNGLSQQQVEQRLAENQLKFHERINDYEQFSGKRLPGPRTHYIHYLNGVRLKDELNSVRQLRHAIVHKGKRIGLFERGIARRCVETMTWLYQSIVEDREFDRISDANFAYFGSMRGEPGGRYNVDFRPNAIEVVAANTHEDDGAMHLTSRELNLRRFFSSFFNKDNDPELIAAMSLTYLGVHLQDGAFSRPPVQEERFIGGYGQSDWLVVAFVDEPSSIDPSTIERIKANRLAREQEFGQAGKCIIVTCLSKVTSVDRARSYYKLDPDILDLAAVEGIRVVTPLDLFQVGVGVERLNWDASRLLQDLIEPTRPMPSCYSSIGEILTYFPKRNAVGFRLEAGMSLKLGDIISVERFPTYVEFEIESLHANRSPCESALGPCEVGVGLPKFNQPWKPKTGAALYRRLDSPLTIQNKHLYSQSYFEAFFANQQEELGSSESASG